MSVDRKCLCSEKSAVRPCQHWVNSVWSNVREQIEVYKPTCGAANTIKTVKSLHQLCGNLYRHNSTIFTLFYTFAPYYRPLAYFAFSVAVKCIYVHRILYNSPRPVPCPWNSNEFVRRAASKRELLSKFCITSHACAVKCPEIPHGRGVPENPCASAVRPSAAAPPICQTTKQGEKRTLHEETILRSEQKQTKLAEIRGQRSHFGTSHLWNELVVCNQLIQHQLSRQQNCPQELSSSHWRRRKHTFMLFYAAFQRWIMVRAPIKLRGRTYCLTSE